MDVSNVSSFASAVSSNKLAQAATESAVKVAKKQSTQEAQVAAILLGSATQPNSEGNADRGKLLAVA